MQQQHATKNTSALSVYLEPLNAWLLDDTVSEISINEPQIAYIERGGRITREELPTLTGYFLQGLANLIARFSDQRLSEQEPLLSARLPAGHRIQIVMPPASEDGKILIAIRKQVIRDLSLHDYEKMGAFKRIKPRYIHSHRSTMTLDEEEQSLSQLFHQKNYLAFLKAAIGAKKNILISGGTSTGKTTFLNACLKEIPLDERIITLEDVREVDIPHLNKCHLLASKGEQGLSKVAMPQLVEVCLRLRPDRIIMGEMRGAEAADFLNATATGHDGSVASIHASHPAMAFMRLVHMIKLNPAMNMNREDILEDLHNIIDIVVQIKRVREGNVYKRYISEIYSAFNYLSC
jgi:type IV secretion system protein VirB11